MGSRVRGHYALLYPNEYLAAPDLRGRDATLTIDRVEIETLKREDGKEDKPVMHFREMANRPKNRRKRLVLNKTNAKTIAGLYGPEVEAWSGCRVTFYATTCQAWGETVDCIRVRDRIPQGRAGNPPHDSDEPDDFDDQQDTDDDWADSDDIGGPPGDE